jgi:hypothetical protein
VADRDRTLAVAVAGIAATALVGLAGTTAAWLSARDDRGAQRALARAERTYERRVAAYLDAISFVEGQERALDEFTGVVTDNRGEIGQGDTFLGLPSHFPEAYQVSLRSRIPWQTGPPTRLSNRLRLFGSPQAFRAFQRTQSIPGEMPLAIGASRSGGGAELIPGHRRFNDLEYRMLRKGYMAFYDQVDRFEDIAHTDVG